MWLERHSYQSTSESNVGHDSNVHDKVEATAQTLFLSSGQNNLARKGLGTRTYSPVGLSRLAISALSVTSGASTDNESSQDSSDSITHLFCKDQ